MKNLLTASRARTVLVMVCCLTAGAARADLAWGFDTAENGFGFGLYGGLLSREQVDGNGYLVLEDGPPDSLTLQVPLSSAPGSWDSWTRYLGGTLSFDVRLLTEVAAVPSSFGQVTVTQAFFNGVSVTAQAKPDSPVSTTGWTTYTIALTPEAGWGDSLSAVMAQPLGAYINFELGSSQDNPARVGVDNVRITSAIPEPATWHLGLMGAVGLGLAVSRRRLGVR
jgi:hypothetical protein